MVVGADLAKIDWDGSIAVKLDNIASLAPIFQDSAGINFPERSIGDDVSLNRGLKVYNKANWSSGALGGNYLLDVVDAVYPGANSPIARFGHSWGTGNFSDFWGGLSVRYDATLDAPVVGITNAILEVSGNRSSGAKVGAVRVAETVNATNGFLIGELKILKGAGSPEGVVNAPAGSLFLRTDGGPTSTLYVKTSGN